MLSKSRNTRAKANAVFVNLNNYSPRVLCSVCKEYYQFIGGKYCCPACGDRGSADELLSNTKKTLKADNPIAVIGTKKQRSKAKDDEDLPKGAVWVGEDTK